MPDFRTEADSLGTVQIPSDKLWGAQTQRAIAHFSIGRELMPREMIAAFAVLKKAAATANHAGSRLGDSEYGLIAEACDELLAGKHADMFPLHVWMSGSGTQFNMNVNEVIANRVSELAGRPLGAKAPAHPNDHVNMSQSTNDAFPTAMHIAAATAVSSRLLPAVAELADAIGEKARAWGHIVKIGRTHLQDATPLTLGQEWSGYEAMLREGLAYIEASLQGVFAVALGGTAVGTGINAPPGFAEGAVAEIARLTGLPFVSAPNRFAAQGAHDALVRLSGSLRALAVSLMKIADDIRLSGCGPRAGLGELILPENEPGSSIMPGKVNPTQCEAMTMIAMQVMGADVAIGLGGAGGHFEMNAYKPLIIFNLMQAIDLLSDGAASFRKYLVEGAQPNEKRIAELMNRSLMLVTALSPAIGYDKAAEIAHLASEHDLSLKQAAMQLGYVSEADFDRLVDPTKMVG
jgi:fumarate hydratase, class II